MAERYIRIHGKLVSVTDEVYLSYYRQDRKARFSQEKHQKQGVVSFHDLDTDEMNGEDAIPDLTTPSVEEIVEGKLMAEQLHRCLAILPESEQKLLHALYFEGQSERKYAESIGITQKAVNKRRHKALAQLKILMKK